jgi:hypothetical protein
MQVFPQNWGAKAQDDAWFLVNYISSRANLTHQLAGKPIVLEEAGVQDTWADRDQVQPCLDDGPHHSVVVSCESHGHQLHIL